MSFLGPFFSIPSAFGERDPGMGQKYFPGAGDDGFGASEDGEMNEFNIGRRNVGDVKMGMGMLYGVYENVVDRLHVIIMAVIKSGPEGKEAILAWMASAINLNLGRGKMRVDLKSVSTDGFMMNIVGVSLKMAGPLIDGTFSKLRLIDPYYFAKEGRIELGEVTRINSDQEATDAYFKELKDSDAGEKSNFVTDLFYVTVCALHYGLGAVVREIKELKRLIEEKRAFVDQHAANVDPRAVRQIAVVKGEIDRDTCKKLSIEAVVLDSNHIRKVMEFNNLLLCFIVRSVYVGSGVDVTNVKWEQFVRGDLQGLELKVGESKLFATMPEFIFEDVCEYYLFVVKYNPFVFENAGRDEFFCTAMFFLTNGGLVKNPYLRGKIVEVLFHFRHAVCPCVIYM
jgi:ubiquitin conjugation factor E4 B